MIPDEQVDSAIAETDTQANVLRVMRSLDAPARERVLRAVGHLMQAEALVPGIFARILEGEKSFIGAGTKAVKS